MKGVRKGKTRKIHSQVSSNGKIQREKDRQKYRDDDEEKRNGEGGGEEQDGREEETTI